MRNWHYAISAGVLSNVDDDGNESHVAIGWAGQEAGRNNPDMVNAHGVGPLPPGIYQIGDPFDDPHTGPYSMRLNPDPANEMYGRSGFRMHGASISDPKHSSEGCIIQQRPIRQQVHESGCRRLEVTND